MVYLFQFQVAHWSDHKSRSCLCTIFATVSLICGVLFAGGAWFRANTNLTSDIFKLSPEIGMKTIQQPTDSSKCKEKCRPIGSEPLPEGIVARISDLEMHPLWGNISNDVQLKASVGLLAISVGISQKILVDKIVTKFLGHNFAVMLFHYDGIVDQWHDLQWSSQVIHVSAMNQTKWWFAKRFLHPDIVADYDYIFLWDEDLGVENFDPGRYLSIVKEEGLEISQPALDPLKSEVHNPITVRMSRSKVHRRYYKYKGGAKCYANSTAPPCVGWVEMMAPVFSRASWRCVWYMIQNDLVHAWGLDTLLGYCSQGDRTTKVGVVDEQYIVHLGLPTLGGTSGSDKNKLVQPSSNSTNPSSESPSPVAEAVEYGSGNRSAVRRRSYDEMIVFRRRWKQAVDQDRCWRDPFAKEH